MLSLLVLLLIAFQTVLSAPVADDLIITLPDGKIQGATYVTENNITYYGFRGIPFATPPIGSLRFEAPIPPRPWTEVWDATKDGKSCISSENGATESEDCLYINVYIPTLKSAEKLPVMHWIYGGAFVGGNSVKSNFGPDFLMEANVIVVTFNYRVGPFGFLSTGDLAIAGNAGLKDQALAIKWTHDNIELFGGDSEKITIFGQSAGGVSTGLQLLSKKVAGLYRAAIVESGSAVTSWSIDTNPKSFVDAITTTLGGETLLNDTQQIKKFLQGKSADEIITKASAVNTSRAGPVIEVEHDDAFLTESPYVLLESGIFNQVPIIIGICANEAGMMYQSLESVQASALRFDESPESIIPLDLRQNSSDNDTIVDLIQSVYLQEGETFSSNLVATTNFQSDTMFTKGVIKHAQLASKYVPVYLYQFAYEGRPLFKYVIPGAEKAAHGAEVAFFFNRLNRNSSDPTDLLTQHRMVQLWSNFAKFLNPTPEETEIVDLIWPTVTPTELSFLNINATLDVRPALRGARYEEWSDIYETYGTKPFITF